MEGLGKAVRTKARGGQPSRYAERVQDRSRAGRREERDALEQDRSAWGTVYQEGAGADCPLGRPSCQSGYGVRRACTRRGWLEMKDESEEQDVTKEAPPGLPSGTRHLGLRSQGRVSERTVGGFAVLLFVHK